MNSTPQDSLTEIYAFRRINDHLATSGQPSAAQFPLIHGAGFEAVINLALATSDNALPNEGGIVSGLGMTYVHIPVNFQTPGDGDFQTFCGIMKTLTGHQTFVHCAANMRVSAFVFLYRVLYDGIEPGVAKADLNAIWEPDEVWADFISRQLKLGKS